MSRASNIKIQKTAAEGIGNGDGRLPAFGLERKQEIKPFYRIAYNVEGNSALAERKDDYDK
jgi:hypothetical protein